MWVGYPEPGLGPKCVSPPLPFLLFGGTLGPSVLHMELIRCSRELWIHTHGSFLVPVAGSSTQEGDLGLDCFISLCTILFQEPTRLGCPNGAAMPIVKDSHITHRMTQGSGLLTVHYSILAELCVWIRTLVLTGHIPLQAAFALPEGSWGAGRRSSLCQHPRKLPHLLYALPTCPPAASHLFPPAFSPLPTMPTSPSSRCPLCL